MWCFAKQRIYSTSTLWHGMPSRSRVVGSCHHRLALDAPLALLKKISRCLTLENRGNVLVSVLSQRYMLGNGSISTPKMRKYSSSLQSRCMRFIMLYDILGRRSNIINSGSIRPTDYSLALIVLRSSTEH